MTPYEIGVLLHYYTRAEDHPDMQECPPVWRPTTGAFIHDHALLRVVPEAEQSQTHPMCYELTSRGRAFCEALTRMPLPEHRWVIPWSEIEIRDNERSGSA